MPFGAAGRCRRTVRSRRVECRGSRVLPTASFRLSSELRVGAGAGAVERELARGLSGTPGPREVEATGGWREYSRHGVALSIRGEAGMPAIVALIGKKKSGKTAVLLELVVELRRRGCRVMTVKHGHDFELDTPGTDSWRHRHEAGSERVVLASPGEVAVVGRWGRAGEPGLNELVSRFLWDADVVVAEGYKGEPVPKIEVYRRAVGEAPIYEALAEEARAGLLAVVSDVELEAPCPVIPLDDPYRAAGLADLLEARYPALRHRSR